MALGMVKWKKVEGCWSNMQYKESLQVEIPAELEQLDKSIWSAYLKEMLISMGKKHEV